MEFNPFSCKPNRAKYGASGRTGTVYAQDFRKELPKQKPSRKPNGRRKSRDQYFKVFRKERDLLTKVEELTPLVLPNYGRMREFYYKTLPILFLNLQAQVDHHRLELLVNKLRVEMMSLKPQRLIRRLRVQFLACPRARRLRARKLIGGRKTTIKFEGGIPGRAQKSLAQSNAAFQQQLNAAVAKRRSLDAARRSERTKL